MDWRLKISVEAAAIFLYWCERVFRTFCSISFMKFNLSTLLHEANGYHASV